jgi:hypothetical protein
MKIEFSEYIPLFNTNFGKLASANHPKLSEMYRNDTLLTTWNISFACLPPYAYNLLALCAFLVNGNQEVPQEILDRAEGFFSWFPAGNCPQRGIFLCAIAHLGLLRERLYQPWREVPFIILYGKAENLSK